MIYIMYIDIKLFHIISQAIVSQYMFILCILHITKMLFMHSAVPSKHTALFTIDIPYTWYIWWWS